jgi:hypothetical protein
MKQAKFFINKERRRINREINETVGDIYFYRELNPYLKTEDRKKKITFLEEKLKELRNVLKELDFLIDIMDKDVIEKIFMDYCQKDKGAV